MKTKFLIPLLAGMAMLCACKGKSHADYEVANTSSSADTVEKDTAASGQKKLIKTAGINFKVKNVQQTAQRIITLTTSMGGTVVHHQMGSTAVHSLDMRISNDSVMQVNSFNTSDDMVVQIPHQKLDAFVDQVGRMGIHINNLTLDISDKSLDYLSSQLKLKSRVELVDQQKTGRVIIKKTEDVLNLKDDMIDQQIGNRHIDDAVKNSIITLSFYESNTINKEIIANDDPSAYNLSFIKRMAMAFGNGWAMFTDLIVGLTNLWVFILIAICTCAAIFRHKNKKTLSV